MNILELKMTKEASLLHFETRFAYETAYFTDIIAISQMPTTYFFDCHPPPPPPTTTKILTTISTPRWVSSKLIDSSKTSKMYQLILIQISRYSCLFSFFLFCIVHFSFYLIFIYCFCVIFFFLSVHCIYVHVTVYTYNLMP